MEKILLIKILATECYSLKTKQKNIDPLQSSALHGFLELYQFSPASINRIFESAIAVDIDLHPHVDRVEND